MTTNKTKPTEKNPLDYINELKDDQQRREAMQLFQIFTEETGIKPVMWGESIIGYGEYKYIYRSGRKGIWLANGFAPRKGKFSLYVLNGFPEEEGLLKDLGPYSRGKSCLYIKHLNAIDVSILRQIISQSFHFIQGKVIRS